MLIYPIYISGTPSSGIYSVNTSRIINGIIKQIILKAATSTTTFYFDITDDHNNVIYNTETAATGTLRQEMEIPIKEINTLRIYTASADEAFTGKLSILEKGD